MLLAAGANVNAASGSSCETVLMAMAGGGNAEVAKILLSAGADVNAANYDGETALIWAAYEGHAEILKILMSAGANPNAKDKDGSTALMWVQEHAEIAKVLLDGGADVNAANRWGQNGFDGGSIGRTCRSCESVVRRLANLNAKDEDGKTALDWAKEKEHSRDCPYFGRGGGERITAGIPFPRRFFTKQKGEIIMEGPIVLFMYFVGVGILIFAVAFLAFAIGFRNFAKGLLSLQEYRRKKTEFKSGNNSLSVILLTGMLLFGGVVNSPVAVASECPLCKPAKNGDIAEVKRLLDGGANPNAVSYDGFSTALMYATFFGHAEIAKILLSAGANPNAAIINGETVLILATIKGHAEIAKMLFSAGANLDLADNNGVTALMIATEKGHAEFVKVLLESGANPNAVDNDGWTALEIAEHYGHTEVISVLQNFLPSICRIEFARLMTITDDLRRLLRINRNMPFVNFRRCRKMNKRSFVFQFAVRKDRVFAQRELSARKIIA